MRGVINVPDRWPGLEEVVAAEKLVATIAAAFEEATWDAGEDYVLLYTRFGLDIVRRRAWQELYVAGWTEFLSVQ